MESDLKVGDRVERITSGNGEYVPIGTKGTINRFDEDGNPIVAWDNGFTNMSFSTYLKVIGPYETSPFTIKDSGKRQEFASGMVRDTEDGKTQWHRIYDGPMIERYAIHLTKGAAKYPDVDGKANWMKAAGEAEYLRAKRSAARHFAQWFRGETDEDHAAATIFNMNLAEYVKENLNV